MLCRDDSSEVGTFNDMASNCSYVFFGRFQDRRSTQEQIPRCIGGKKTETFVSIVDRNLGDTSTKKMERKIQDDTKLDDA